MSPRPPRSRAALLGGALALVAVVATVAWVALGPRPSDAPDLPAPHDNAITVQPPGTPVAEPPPPLPDIALDTVRGVTTDGRVFWLTRYLNDDAETLASPGMVVTRYDADRRSLPRLEARAAVPRLEPQQDVVVLVTGDGASFARAEVLAAHPAPVADTTSLRIPGTDARAEGRPVERVTARLTAPEDVSVQTVVLEGFDADGHPAAYATTTPPTAQLDAGEGMDVAIPVGPWVVRPPARWRVYAVARPR